MAKNDFQYGGWNSYTLQCGRWLWDDMPLIRPNVRHIGILHLVSISTISPQSTCQWCHTAPIDYPRPEKMMLCRLSRWRISAIFDFRGPIMGSLKSSCTTSYRSSIETIALNLLSFWENSVFLHLGDRQTNKQMDSTNALSRSRCRERRLSGTRNDFKVTSTLQSFYCKNYMHTNKF